MTDLGISASAELISRKADRLSKQICKEAPRRTVTDFLSKNIAQLVVYAVTSLDSAAMLRILLIWFNVYQQNSSGKLYLQQENVHCVVRLPMFENLKRIQTHGLCCKLIEPLL